MYGSDWVTKLVVICWLLIIFLWQRKLVIHLVNLLFRPIEVNVKIRPSYHTWTKAFSTSRNIPVVGWSLQKSSLIVSKSLNRLPFVLLFFLKPFCCLLIFLLSKIAKTAKIFCYNLFESFTEVGKKTERPITSYWIFWLSSLKQYN